MLKGSFLLSDGRLDDALKIAADAVEKHREGVPAYYLLGRVQTARKQNEAAIAAYQEVIRLNPLASDAKLDLARLQLVSGRTDTSVAFAEEALKAQPQNPNARLVLVQGLIMRGDLDRAEQDLNVLKTRYPKSAPVHVQLGMLAGRRNQAADARREFEQALQLQPTSLEAVAGLVALDVAAHKFEDARARVDGLTSAADPKPAALMLAARTYATTGDPKSRRHSCAARWQPIHRILRPTRPSGNSMRNRVGSTKHSRNSTPWPDVSPSRLRRSRCRE